MALPTLKIIKTSTLALVLLGFAGAGAAQACEMHERGAENKYRSESFQLADSGKHNRGKHDRHDDDHDHDHDNDDAWVRVYIGPRDRDAIERYIRNDRRGHCPPGLAKKHNGCLPPGQAKKYRVGDRLPDDVVFYPVGDDLRHILSPLPRGYEYVQIDKDILLISEAGKKVIDAVTLLSAVGN